MYARLCSARKTLLLLVTGDLLAEHISKKKKSFIISGSDHIQVETALDTWAQLFKANDVVS